ncbi:MAG: EamA family transporter [Actinobacteria bacterium]|nr:EamA family transporter [Actinomycetota bacterium]
MPPEVFAAVAALSYAASNICIRLGVQSTSVVAGLLVSLLSGSLITLIAFLVDLPNSPSLVGVAIFAISGLLGPGLGRAAMISGIERLGPAIAIPVLSSLYPVFAVAGAMITLNEDVSARRFVGLAVVVLGVWILSQKEASMAPTSLPTGTSTVATPTYRIPAIVIPLAAGVFYGAGDVFRKKAVELLPDAVLGSFIGITAALLVWSAMVALSNHMRALTRFGKGSWWLALSGAFSAIAVLSVTKAFEEGDVTVVTPIVAAQSLPVLLLSAIFLRRIDHVDFRIALGTICVVGGSVIVSSA